MPGIGRRTRARDGHEERAHEQGVVEQDADADDAPTSVRPVTGRTLRTAKTAATRTPALVRTPPVTASASIMLRRVVVHAAPSRARLMRKLRNPEMNIRTCDRLWGLSKRLRPGLLGRVGRQAGGQLGIRAVESAAVPTAPG